MRVRLQMVKQASLDPAEEASSLRRRSSELAKLSACLVYVPRECEA